MGSRFPLATLCRHAGSLDVRTVVGVPRVGLFNRGYRGLFFFLHVRTAVTFLRAPLFAEGGDLEGADSVPQNADCEMDQL